MAASPASTSATTVGVPMAPYPTGRTPAAEDGPSGGLPWGMGDAPRPEDLSQVPVVCPLCHQVHERCEFEAGSVYCARPGCRNPHTIASPRRRHQMRCGRFYRPTVKVWPGVPLLGVLVIGSGAP
jgi:hypothetical protein